MAAQRQVEGGYASYTQTLSTLGAVQLLDASHHSHLEQYGSEGVGKLAKQNPWVLKLLSLIEAAPLADG